MLLFKAAYRIANPLFISCIDLIFRLVPPTSILALAAIGIVLLGSAANGEDTPTDKNKDIYSMPLEALLQMEVTTSARHPEKLSESPAAISVITQEDIHRSGATTIAEALRLAPGLEVARMDSSDWAITARGFNDVFANKLLVLQDGRTIYTPLFSGVFWDVQGTMLEDIDRIEVIRGPGATLWGANAVNGVISIISRSARDTQGTLLSLGGGSEDRGFAAARYGGKISDNAWFRVYANYYNHDDQLLPNGDSADDAWQIGRTGFRVDWDLNPDQDLVTLQGDLYRGEVGHIFGTFDPTSPTLSGTVHDKATVDGGNILGRWSHVFSAESDLSLQLYYDRTERNTAIFKEQRDTFDIDFQDRFGLWNWNSVIWGAGYRFTADRVGNTPTISLFPDKRALNLYSGFLQDEIKLVPDVLGLTLGSKCEHNDFTGFEIQPGARLLWTPHANHTVWASVSRAVRTPSRAEDDIELNSSAQVAPGVFVPATIHGSSGFDSEELIAYELGYRSQFKERVSLDIAGYYNDFADGGSPIAVLRDGDLYYASNGKNMTPGGLQVTRQSPNGQSSIFPPDGNKTTEKLGITGLAPGPDGSLYIASPSAISKLKPDGTFTILANPIELKDCDVDYPDQNPQKPLPSLRGLAVDEHGFVFAAAVGCHAVVKFSPDGKKVETILKVEHPWSPTGVALHRGEIYILEYSNANGSREEGWQPRVRKLAHDGKVTTLMTSTFDPQKSDRN